MKLLSFNKSYSSIIALSLFLCISDGGICGRVKLTGEVEETQRKRLRDSWDELGLFDFEFESSKASKPLDSSEGEDEDQEDNAPMVTLDEDFDINLLILEDETLALLDFELEQLDHEIANTNWNFLLMAKEE